MKLEVEAVSKRYAIPVLDDVSFQAAAGELVCLLGPNGCGKTTLLRIIGGLERPSAGEVRLDGRPVVAGAASDFHVGVVFQEDRLLPWMTLEENVALVLKPLGGDAAARREAARRYLRFVGLAELRGLLPEPGLGRHAAAGGHRPRPRRRAGHAPDGRALRLPRRPEPADHADRAPADLDGDRQAPSSS